MTMENDGHLPSLAYVQPHLDAIALVRAARRLKYSTERHEAAHDVARILASVDDKDAFAVILATMVDMGARGFIQTAKGETSADGDRRVSEYLDFETDQCMEAAYDAAYETDI